MEIHFSFLDYPDKCYHQTAGYDIDKLNKNNPPPKFIKIRIQNNKTINSLCTELISGNIINKLNTSPNADPNNNYNILHTLIENATNKHIPDKVINSINTNINNLTGSPKEF